MTKNKSSQTAAVVNFIRAASYNEKIPELKSNDYLASIFTPLPLKVLTKFEFSRRWVQRNLPYGTYEYIVARTKYIDEVISEAIKNKFDQIVILGAGFDTRGIRLVKDRKIKIFEVDQKETQEVKRRILGKNKVEMGENYKFLELDLNKAIEETLGKIEKGKKTLFIMEGLLMYLEAEAVDKLFKVIKEIGGKGSEIVFDNIFPDFVEGRKKEEGKLSAKEIVEKANEKWRFGVKEGEMKKFLKERGFELIEELKMEELGRRYFGELGERMEIRISPMHEVGRGRKLSTVL